jgi:hypothetical protein
MLPSERLPMSQASNSTSKPSSRQASADVIAFPARDSLRIIGAQPECLWDAAAPSQVRRLRRELEVWQIAIDNLDQCIKSDPSLAALAPECDRIRALISATTAKLESPL